VRGTGLRRWLYAPLAGLAAAAAGVAVVIVVANSGGGNSVGFGNPSSSSAASAAATTAASSSASAGSAASGAGAAASGAAGAGPQIKPYARTLDGHARARAAAGTAKAAPAAAAASSSTSAVPSPVIPQGRQVVQSAQLQLSAAPSRIDDVAQQVFNVVGEEKGFVNSSNVTSGGGNAGVGAGAGATFQLSVPSANLSATLTELSRLRGAHVVSRTDQTNDITGQVGGAGQKLAEARALRRSLLKQLANATTTLQVNSIQARLHDANASIASDLSTLRGLQRQVAYSKISLNIEPANAPPPVTTHHSSGFGIGQAAHDAGRVLVVVAGVALIVLAVLVPVALVAALAAWVGLAVRRRRREHALDLV
jgi:hypothetical protein